MDKIPIVNRPEYIIYLEYFNNLYFIHTDVFRWSGELKKKYLEDLDQLQELLGAPLYGLVEDWNIKLSKFGGTVGFTYVKDIIGNDNNTYKIYKRTSSWARQ